VSEVVAIPGPRIERVRHELRRRRLSVLRVERLAPQMARVVFGGTELEGFTSLGFDDHVKLVFGPLTEGVAPSMRDFTPRRYDAARGELAIDFFLHEAGPAAEWARAAKAGDVLTVAGPKGSAVIPLDGIDHHVLIGDETAVPAIARRLEELPADAHVSVFVEGESATPWIEIAANAPERQVQWIAREAAGEAVGAALAEALRRHAPFAPRTFFWIAGESRVARALRRQLREEHGVSLPWIKASGYWQRGAVGAHEAIADET